MAKTELSKRYEPGEIETSLYERWEAEGYFTPDVDREKPKFTIVIPPPNVTGRLHIGHALVNTLIDIVTRWKRMSGYNTLFLPGTDHAGIATQMIVERDLAAKGISRLELGREAFIEKVWEVKQSHRDSITGQLKRLGTSCDWTRERFTLDEGLSKAVRHVFVKLYEDGLIYRAFAMVNWCPKCRTAISDVEVEFRERAGKIWELAYPLSDGSGKLVVATTRPETMLGDTAVAVHPDDDRYRKYVGRTVRLPLSGREVPVIADAILVDPEFGTGVVKLTPAHDKSDYESGRRNNLDSLQVIDEEGKMTAGAGRFAGLDRFEARKAVLAALEAEGALVSVKDYASNVGHHGKCDTIVEPMVSRQWFVKIEPLAKPALEVVRNRTVQLVPQSWESTYFNWMENIHDWCISRQLWWGHRIPAYYCEECSEIVVAENEPERCTKCGATKLRQETDVLDTWFSSALWPFSTMGWPEKTKELDTFYPTDTLITGFDILFFWVARMIMMGLRFTGEVPFTTVFLNGLVRDEHGQKMSKTKGNVIDPLEVIDEYGADAVRFTLAILTSGRDIPLARNRMQGYSAFANKIWNASRFALMHIDTKLSDASPIMREDLRTVERWILSRLNDTTKNVNRALSAFRFDEAANLIYQFFWHEFCDWYIEMAKPVLLGKHGDKDDQERAKRVLLEVLDRSLRLLHPFMPFITEEIWLRLEGVEPSIMVAPYPIGEEVLEDEEAERMIAMIQEIITKVRNIRAEKNLTPSERPHLYIRSANKRDAQFFEGVGYLLTELARLSGITIDGEIPERAHRDAVAGVEIGVVFPEKQITREELDRIAKQVAQLEKQLDGTRARLSDEKFVERAPAHILEQTRQIEADLVARIEKLRQNLGAEVS
jgi:valyl-tRNA synthetase